MPPLNAIRTKTSAGTLRYTDAARSRGVKTAVPSPMKSVEWQQVDPAIRERALFSAQVTNAQFLQEFDDQVRSLAQGETDFATARLRMKEYLNSISYTPTAADAGTITDLSSDKRLDLILKTNTEQAQGYGWFAQGQDPDLLDQWPCQELYRSESRQVPRDWLQRWRGAGGRLYGGRMIARKDDPIWRNLGPFGTPYPPFDYNSGMDVQDIDREEAIALGVIQETDQVQPQDATFGGALDLPAGIRDDQLRSAVSAAQGAMAR